MFTWWPCHRETSSHFFSACVFLLVDVQCTQYYSTQHYSTWLGYAPFAQKLLVHSGIISTICMYCISYISGYDKQYISIQVCNSILRCIIYIVYNTVNVYLSLALLYKQHSQHGCNKFMSISRRVVLVCCIIIVISDQYLSLRL